MNAKQQYNLEATPVAVVADGPYETDGDGGFEYRVFFSDEDGECIDENKRCMWIVWEYEELQRFASDPAKKFNLELIIEAMAA